ncbi:MAG: pilus assembly protein PilO, partial [Methylotenera sp.]
FATDISKLSRIVTLGEVFVTNKDAANKSKDVKAKPNSSDSTLVMEAVAKTYRYLDAAEIAEKRKAESEKAKSLKKGK